MKTKIFHSRDSLTTIVLNNPRWFTGLLATTTILGTSFVQAASWRSAPATSAWNTFGNWSGTTGGSDTVIVNIIPLNGNVATITANITPIPTNITVGFTAAGRVNHVAGNASVLAGNDLMLGYQAGGVGTYNLANTAASGGALTTFGQGSGNLTIPKSVYVGGFLAAASGTLNIHTSGTLAVGSQLLVGNLGGTGTVKMDSGTLTVVDDMEIGNGASSTGTFSMSGGTVTKSGTSTAVTIGGGLAADGGTGTANLNGGTFTTAGVFRVGQNMNTPSVPHSIGTLNLGGTALTVNGELWIGNNTGASGTMNFSAGLLTTNNWTHIGRKDDANTGAGATGTVNMSGGTWTKTGESNFVVGDTGAGTMTMTGGTVIVTPHATADRGVTWIGNRNNATGALTISGAATEFRSPRFVLGVESGTTGTLNLNGGTVKTTGFNGVAGDSTVNFGDTQIIATGNSSAFIDSLTAANLNANLKVDTAGFSLTAPQALAGVGGVVKSGAGTLSLTGANSYAGSHTVSAGKLAVATSSSGIGDFTVEDGAAMGVIQTSGISALTVNNVTLGASAAASLDIELADASGNPTTGPLNVTGTLTLNGPVALNVADAQPELGIIPLVTYVGSKAGSGSFVPGSLPLGVTATLLDNGTGLVSLEITDISFPVWQGTVDGNWDTTTQNWIDQVTSAPLFYHNPLPVTFNDSATGSTDLLLNTIIPVSPGNVTFSNETKPYTLSGTSKITGPTGLTKSGAASLAISTANDYTGVTTLTGGTTTVGLLTNGGVASPLGAASAAAANLVLNGGTLEYTGGVVTIDRGLMIGGLGSSISNASNLTLSGVIEGTSAGSFQKKGAGSLNLTNAAVTLGGLGQINEILAGTLSFSGPGQTASVPGQLWVGSAPNVPAHLAIQNTNLTVGGLIALGRGNGDTGTVSTLSATNSVVQIGSFSTGFDAGLATNDSDQTVTLNNTNWTTSGTTLLAERQNSTTNMTFSGTTVYTARDRIQMAINNTAVCNLTIQDSAGLVHSGGWFSVGNDGTSTLTVKNSGSLSTLNADFNISDVGTSTGTLNIQDNATVSATGVVFVGKNSGTTGTVNMTGGTFSSTTYITIGRRSGSTGNFNLSGGTVSQTDAGAGFNVGENGNGTLTVSGGTLDINGGGLYLSAEGTGTSHSVAYLNGGTIIAKRVVQRDLNPANYTEFHFNGGILRAHTGASADFMSNHDLVTLDGGGAFIDSNNQAIAISQVLGGSGGLTKQGAGTLTLSGVNTYSGNTTVSAGTLSLSNAFLSNTGIVTIASAPGTVLNLNYVGTDQVGGLTIGSSPVLPGIYDATTHPGLITGTGKLQVTTVTSPYVTWINGFPSIPPADRDPGDDPDNDGNTNAVEFALGSIPNSGGSRAKIYTLVADSNDVGTENELLMTIAVLSGTPAFTGSPSPTATLAGYTYTVQGSTTLGSFTTVATPVNVVAPPAPNATPPAGYEYRTFSLSGSNGTPGEGFLRVKVTY